MIAVHRGTADRRRPATTPLADTLSAAWYASLVALLAMDVGLRNVASDLATWQVLTLWAVAFAGPWVVTLFRRRTGSGPAGLTDPAAGSGRHGRRAGRGRAGPPR